MKLLSILFCAVTAATLQADEPPETYIPSRYYDLWRSSPFTDPPPVEEKEEVKNDLEDWVLMGVRKYKDSQIVTVVNSKDRSQRVEIPGSDANELGFAILEVKMARSFLNTEVHLQKGPHRGWVQYDPKFLVVKRAAGPSKSSKSSKTSSKQPPRPGSTSQSKPPIPGGSRTPSKSTGKPSPPSAAGSRPTTGSTGTKGSSTPPKKSRVRYVPRPK
ncbi:MAG: hypothetical protein P8H96_13970 [Akkermansiaceae bacterium]|nr:hypothetical protein [Akkermansiaceae bacterium]